MDVQLLVFCVLAAVGLCSAVLVISTRNLVHSALYLIIALFSVAGVYVILQAEFLAVVQVLVYAGGVMVLFLFVIMLVDLPVEIRRRGPARAHVLVAGLLTALMIAGLAYYFAVNAPGRSSDTAALGAQGGNIETVALTLFRYYLLPFEAVSILLLVAMVGAIVLARTKA